MKQYAKPSLDEFELKGHEVIHKPTNASWVAYPARPEPKGYNRSMLGSVLSDGTEYDENEVAKIALGLLANRPIDWTCEFCGQVVKLSTSGAVELPSGFYQNCILKDHLMGSECIAFRDPDGARKLLAK